MGGFLGGSWVIDSSMLMLIDVPAASRHKPKLQRKQSFLPFFLTILLQLSGTKTFFICFCLVLQA